MMTREELKKAAYGAACGSMAAYDVWEGTKTDAARANYEAAKTASEILYAAVYQQVTREELVKNVDTALTAWDAAVDDADAWRAAAVAWDVAKAALKAYDKENT